MKPLTCRKATVADWEAIVKLHREQQAEQGTNYELPWLFAHPIIIALVEVDEHDVVQNCFYCEAVAEMRFVGCNAKALACARREAKGLAYVLRSMGYRWLETYVPRQLKKMIQKPLRLAGFACVDREFSHYAKDLRG